MRRVILDTNILLVAISKRTVYHVIWQAFQNDEFELWVTTDILDEYAEKITGALFKHLKPGDFPQLILESGRALVDEAGYLISTVFAFPLPEKSMMLLIDCYLKSNGPTQIKSFSIYW